MTLPNQLKNTKFNLHWIFKNKEAVELIIAEFSNSNSYYKSVWDFTMDYENYYLSLGNKLSLRWERVRDIPSRKNFVKLMSFEIAYRNQNLDSVNPEEIKFEIPGLSQSLEALSSEYLIWLHKKTKKPLPATKTSPTLSKTQADLAKLGAGQKTGYRPRINATMKKHQKQYYIEQGKRKIQENSVSDNSFGALLVHEDMAAPFWHFLEIVNLFDGLENYLRAIGLKPTAEIEDIYFEFLVQGAISYLKTSGSLKDFKGFQIDDPTAENYIELFDDKVRLAWKKFDSVSKLLTALNMEIIRRILTS
jgi:hypothetical protein